MQRFKPTSLPLITEENPNNHLAHFIHLFKPEKMGNVYVLEGNELYMTEELNLDYNIIVMDCRVFGK
ncbi:hypothetical protein ABH892_002580 [Paenibacillus sp. RC254]